MNAAAAALNIQLLVEAVKFVDKETRGWVDPHSSSEAVNSDSLHVHVHA